MEQHLPAPAPEPPAKHSKIKLVVVVLILAGLVAFFLLKDRETPAPEEETTTKEAAPETAAAPEETPSGLENFISAWQRIRQVLSPQSIEERERRNFLGDEADAARAQAILNRLVYLNQNRNQEAIADLLNQIEAIGYPAIKPILEMLPNYKTGNQAYLLLLAMERIPDVEVGDELITLMHTHTSQTVRDKAREIFLDRATPEQRQKLLDEIIADLKNNGSPKNANYRINQMETLGALGGTKALEVLSNVAISEKNLRIRKAAVSAIGRIKSDAAQELLLEILRTDSVMRRAAVEALAQPSSDYFSRQVIALFDESSDSSVKASVLEVLGGHDNDTSRTYLLDVIRYSGDTQMVRAASKAVAATDSPQMTRALIDVLKTTEDQRQRNAIISAMSQMGEKSIPILEETALTSNGALRRDAIRSLSQIRKPQAFEALKKILEDESIYDDPQAQSILLRGLKRNLRKDITPTLEKIAAQSPEATVRRDAMEVTADYKKRAALPFVMQMFKQDDSDIVRRGALRIMRRYGNRETARMLREELLYGTNPHLREEIERTITILEKR